MSYTPQPVKENSIWAILVVAVFMSMAIGLFAFGVSKKPAVGVDFPAGAPQASAETTELRSTASSVKANTKSKNAKLADIEVE